MTTPGIGASGQMGIAAEVLPPPVATSATPTAGGALTAGTYKYYITAVNANGETTVSNELTGTTSAGDLTLAILWAAVPGATAYRIYRTAAGGATGTQLFLAQVTAPTVTYNDAAVGAPAGAFPTVNTAGAAGTYVAPTKFFPFISESLNFQQATNFRRPIRKSADIIGAVAGDAHIEGDIEMEALEDVVIHFLYASRISFVKSGGPNYTYTGTPTPAAIPTRTLSITVEKNGSVFGYVGCVVSSFTFTMNEGTLMFNCSIVGQDEDSEALPVPTFTPTVPFGVGQYKVEIPTATQVFDTDQFEWMCEDNATPEYRMKDTGRGAQFIRYGERAMTLSVERDFLNRTDYDAFKALTSQSVTVVASKGVNNSITLLTPVSFKDTYEISLSGQGDLVRSSIAYQCAIDGAGASYSIVVKTQENVT